MMIGASRPFLLSLVVAAALAIDAAAAFAQAPGAVGLSIGYPAAVGVLWQATSRIGVRPELDFSFGGTESESTFEPRSSSYSYASMAIGISALVRVYRQESLSLYLSPRYRYGQHRATYGEGFSEGTSGISDHTVGGAVGMYYELIPRFGLFGELGFNHWWTGRSTASAAVLSSDSGFTRNELRSGLGAVLFF